MTRLTFNRIKEHNKRVNRRRILDKLKTFINIKSLKIRNN